MWMQLSGTATHLVGCSSAALQLIWLAAAQRHCNLSGWLQLSGTATHLVGCSSAALQPIWLAESADLSYFTGDLDLADFQTVIHATLQQFIGGLTGV